MLHKWVVCVEGKGRIHERGEPENRTRKFKDDSVALLQKDDGKSLVVWLIGRNETWTVPANKVENIDVIKTGDKFKKKICNICHCLLAVSQFARNQTNRHGIIRRPTCIRCRTDIDKRAPKSSQAKHKEKERPEKGSPFKCPICQKRSIVGITAKIVADHDHHTSDLPSSFCKRATESSLNFLVRFSGSPRS